MDVRHGTSVRVEDTGLFEGTWAGAAGLSSVLNSTTVFGSGMVQVGKDLVVVNPSHHLDGVYHARVGDRLIFSNSLVGVLSAGELQIDPNTDYSTLFQKASSVCWMVEDVPDGLAGPVVGSQWDLPTLSEPVTLQLVDNLRITPDLVLLPALKQREPIFTSFSDYSARLHAALASIFENALPYDGVASLSSGYDTTAIAAVAASVGCRRAIGFDRARPSPRDGRDEDSGAETAERLGLAFESFDRLAYRDSADMPEAEFLASGTAGEDVIFESFEPALRKTVFLSGYWAGREWAMADRDAWRHVRPTSTAGADLTEFRLRADFFYVPLPVFGSIRSLEAPSILDGPEMDAFRVGGYYDRPIPRRLAEEAGIPRGSFATVKRAGSILFPAEGPHVFSRASRESFEAYAASAAEPAPFQRRRAFSRADRAILRVAHALRVEPIARRLEQRRARLVHFEPRFGNLVFRWAVDTIANRYAAVSGLVR